MKIETMRKIDFAVGIPLSFIVSLVKGLIPSRRLSETKPRNVLFIELSEMGSALPEIQWTMNFALGETGIHHPKLRQRAIAIGENLGIYRDYPCSKGCTSPVAPIWINAIVSRQG